MADHTRINLQHQSFSCGIMSLSGLTTNNYNEVAFAIASRLYHPSRGEPVAYLIWSDLAANTDGTSLNQLSNWMASKGFVSISKSPTAENPRTGNIIVVTTLLIHHEVFKEWYSKERARKFAVVGT